MLTTGRSSGHGTKRGTEQNHLRSVVGRYGASRKKHHVTTVKHKVIYKAGQSTNLYESVKYTSLRTQFIFLSRYFKIKASS